MMDPEQVRTPRRRMDIAFERAKMAIKRGRVELVRISRVGKLKLDLSRLQRERSALYRKLGEETYHLLKEDRFDSSSVEVTVSEIHRLSQQIETQRKAVDHAVQQPKQSPETRSSE